MTQLPKLQALISAATAAIPDAEREELFASSAGHALVNAAFDLFECDQLYSLAGDVEHELSRERRAA